MSRHSSISSARDPPVALLAERVEPAVDRAEADRQRDPPVRQPVDGGHLAGQLPRPPPRRRGEHRAEADRRRARRGEAEADPRVDAPHRLPHEQPVPAVASAVAARSPIASASAHGTTNPKRMWSRPYPSDGVTHRSPANGPSCQSTTATSARSGEWIADHPNPIGAPARRRRLRRAALAAAVGPRRRPDPPADHRRRARRRRDPPPGQPDRHRLGRSDDPLRRHRRPADSATCRRCSAARSSGASCSPSPAPAATSPA